MYQRMVGCHGDDDDKPSDSNKKVRFRMPLDLNEQYVMPIVQGYYSFLGYR